MRYIECILTDGVASDEIWRSDGTIYTFDHTTAEDGEGGIVYCCKGYLVSPDDLEGIKNGMLPPGFQWDETLHRLFRMNLHQRTDNEYVMAQRMLRITGDTKWQTYIDALDQWNASVTALKSTFSTDVPLLPVSPLDRTCEVTT